MNTDQRADLRRGEETKLLLKADYLRITKLQVGLILNFKHARLEWERVVL